MREGGRQAFMRTAIGIGVLVRDGAVALCFDACMRGV